MKYKSVHQKLEQLAQNHLLVPSLHKAQEHDRYDVSGRQIEKALRAAYLMGEKVGYEHGFKDAKTACECSLEEHVHADRIIQMHVDRENQFV